MPLVRTRQLTTARDLGHVGAGDIIAILDKRTEMSRNRRRQTVLLSATLHANLGKLATLSLTNPVSVGIR